MNRRVRLTVGLGHNLNELAGRAWGRNGFTVLLESLEMEFDRLVDRSENFLARCAHGDATRQVGDIRTVGGGAFFDDDEISA